MLSETCLKVNYNSWGWHGQNKELYLLFFLTNFDHLILLNFQEDGGIATTGKIRRTKKGDVGGRDRGSERGKETQLNAKTPITRTKRSTGIAEATTQTQSPLQMALYSSALNRPSLAPPHPPPVILPFFLLQNFPTLAHCSPPLTPPCRGVAATCMIWI